MPTTTERIIAQWVSGALAADGEPARVPAGDDGAAGASSGAADRIGRVVVVDTDEWIPALVASGLIDGGVALLHRGDDASTGVAHAAGWRRTYTGSFQRSGGEVVVADGFRLRQISYGLGDFTCLDAPTTLAVMDEHDFSAFLRDADVAWATGTFANHVTHPLAVLANLAVLGATATATGPDSRLFVGSDGAVSTSPFGAVLGRAEDSLASVAERWSAAHAVDPIDSVSLHSVVHGSDRVDAVGERPWLPRYFQAAGALRAIRAEHLHPGRVSGFGGRIVEESGAPTAQPDHPAVPVLVEVGHCVRAVDPMSGAWVALAATQTATAERLIDRPAGEVDAAEVVDLERVLAAAGLATGWIGAATNPTGGPQ